MDLKWEGRMKLRQVYFIYFIIFILTLLIPNPGFSQVKKEETISFSGFIDNIPADFKSIIVNERRIFISSDTKIVDEKGNILKIGDLKKRYDVTIEALQRSNGVVARKITVKKRK
jgi:hypothetical protein